MFGFLKQKLADFGNKLKQTISKEETLSNKEETKEIASTKELPLIKNEIKAKEIKKTEKIKEEPKETETKKIETKKEIKEQIKETKIETKKEEPKKVPIVKTEAKESKPTQKETISEEKTKPKGILSKIFNLGKKETKILETSKAKEEDKDKIEEIVKEETKKEINKPTQETKDKAQKEAKPEIKQIVKEEILPEEKTQIETKEEIENEIEEEIEEAEEELVEEEISHERPRDIHVAKVDEDKRELKANIGVGIGLKGLIFGGIEISEKQIEDLLWELELSLIESDVEQDAALELVKQIKQRLVGKKVSAKNIDEYLKEQIKEILSEMMKTPVINVLDAVKEAKKNGEVYKILILGPNGAGKTTTIAKLVHYFQKNKLSCILAAGDTFRAGAIDQIEVHAKKLNVRVIKHQYGADPAAIAFDAINAATAGKIDVVLIDSAGRQETNKNLMEELKKLERVAKPNLKLFVGESYVGQGLLDQVEEFEKMIGINGYILTKLDTDAKGGTAISLTYKTKKPIIFIGTGQEYDDFEEFSSEYILNRII